MVGHKDGASAPTQSTQGQQDGASAPTQLPHSPRPYVGGEEVILERKELCNYKTKVFW